MKWWMVKFLRLWDLWINRYESRQIKQPFGIIFHMNWIHKAGNLKTGVQIESTNRFPYMIPGTLQIFNQLYGFRWSNILQSDLFHLTFCPTHNSKKNSHSIITTWSVVYHRILHKTIDTKNYVLRVCNCSELSCQKCLNHLTKYFCANHHPMALQKQSNQSYIGIILH
jgi:hypothetical protein